MLARKSRSFFSTAAALLACGFGCADGGSATGAATAVGLGVATAGVNRAITKDCWARCSKGYVCNQESGLCEKGECIPSCGPGYSCTRTTTGNTCIAQGTPALDPVGDPSRADRLGPRGVRGDPLAPESPAERNTRSGVHSEGGQVQIPAERPSSPPPTEEGSLDRVNRTPRADQRERGASVLADLDKLVSKWRPRSQTKPEVALEERVGPPTPALEAYAKTIHETHVHGVYSRGWLGSLSELSQTHALSNRELSVTIGLVIDVKTGNLELVYVIESSGSELFDVGSLEAMTRSAPFPPPPKELASSDDRLYLKWRLFRHEDYACSTSFLSRLSMKSE